jgi:D-3-phosphoglycerate dehydrogenase
MTHKPQIVVTDFGFRDLDQERAVVEGAGGQLASFQCKSETDVIEAARDADGLLVQYAPITPTVISKLNRCKVIVRYGIGVDNVDLRAAQQRGISVCNVPDYCIDEVADHALAMTMALIRQLPETSQRLREGLWSSVPPRTMAATSQLLFATLGFGRTARAVLDRARAFKFTLATCDPYLSSAADIAEDVSVLSFEAVIRQADVVSLHLPLNTATSHLIDVPALAKMKPTAFLINTARGGLVDTLALADALRSGTLAGAGLDVFETEPLEANHPLLKCSNIILTPHIAWYSQHSVEKLQRMAAEEVMRALAGKQLRNEVTASQPG